MADECDIANDVAQQAVDAELSKYKGYQIPEGKPGDCERCGEWFSRLVDGACVACRTKYRLN